MELENEIVENVNEENKNEEKKNYQELEKLRKIIENLNTVHHLEIAKIFKSNNIKLTENNNGIFINLNKISPNIIKQIKQYINFIKNQEKIINVDESKKELLENIFFKTKEDSLQDPLQDSLQDSLQDPLQDPLQDSLQDPLQNPLQESII